LDSNASLCNLALVLLYVFIVRRKKVTLKGYNIGVYDFRTNWANIDRAKELGANCVRYPLFTPTQNIMAPAAWRGWLSQKMETLNRTYERARQQEMDIILSLHSSPGGTPEGWFGYGEKPRYARKLRGPYTAVLYDKNLQDILVEGWRMLALRYKGAPRIVMYDLLNEPLGAHKRWVKLAKRIIKAIRVIDPDKPLSISTISGSVEKIRKFKRPLPGENLVYTVHEYWPGNITHYGTPANPVSRPYLTVASKAKLKEHLSIVKNWQRKHKTKIFIGETGCTRFYPSNQFLYLQDVLDVIREYNWDVCVHAVKECSAWDPDAPNEAMKTAFCEPVEYSHTDRSEMLKEHFTK